MAFCLNVILLLLFKVAANSLPNLLNDWDSQLLSSDGIAFDESGSQDIALSEPLDTYLFDRSSDETSLIESEISPLLPHSRFDGAISSVFQDSTEAESSPTFDICPLGYWNRCCNRGVCF